MSTTWTPEDQADYERMRAAQAINHAHNVAKMDEAGIPQRVRSGFFKAALYDNDRIQAITQYDRLIATRKGDEHRWAVVVSFSDESYSLRSCYIVGPRGGTTKAY